MACVELPEFPLQLLLKRHPDWAGRPVVVVDRDKPQGVILRVNEQARAARIRTGMRYAAGLSLAHTLHAGEVPSAEVERGVAVIAGRLHRFSPGVEPCRDAPGIFWLNASGLSYLHASLSAWAREIVATLDSSGFRAVVAVGFTRFGTHAVARTLTRGDPVVVIRDPAGEQVLAGRVRLSLLGIDPTLRDRLHKLGIHTVRAFLRLPSGGIRRRFGPEAQRLHRLAADELWAPLQPLRLPDPFVAHQDFDEPETDAVRLLFHIKSLLDRLLAAVSGRHEALAELTLHLRLDRADPHTERIRPAAPTLDVVQIMNLVRLRMESLALGAGVTEVRVSGRAVAVTAVQQGLFIERPPRDHAAAERALARIRAEFGDEAVMRVRIIDAHLPEARFAWEPVRTVAPPEPRKVVSPSMVRRIHVQPSTLPARLLLELSSRLAHPDEIESVTGIDGPYIVSGGWWRSVVHREYYFLHMRDGELLWIYYDRPRRRWLWQGQVE